MIILIAKHAQTRGWRVLEVGGAVRDRVLSLPPKDIDLEFYGPSPDELLEFLVEFGSVDAVGKSFGVFKLSTAGQVIDCSLPRRESKAGQGHKGFMVEADPTMTVEEAAARRDFTINSMAVNPISDSLVDPFDGVADLHNRILRATSSHFSEDPLRVLRGFQFCGRFKLSADPWTVEQCVRLLDEYDTLPKERIWTEWEKWAKLSAKPSLGLVFLAQTEWLGLYPELTAMTLCPQDPEYHPEGGAWVHSVIATDIAAQIARRECLCNNDRIVLMFAALLHDVGKPGRTTHDPDGHIRSREHNIHGVPLAESFLHSIGAPSWLFKRVLPLVQEHMFHVTSDITPRTIRRLSVRLKPSSIRELLWVVEVDHSSRPPLPPGLPKEGHALAHMAEEVRVMDSMPAPILMGRHLVELGMTPGLQFGSILRDAYAAQLDGEFSDLEGALVWLAESDIGLQS